MADLASLVLAVDSTAVKAGTAALDGLTASGARAEAATAGLAGGFKGASSEAAAMASAAQLSARSAMDLAGGFGTAEKSVRLNTMAMRESLVVARELSRGNFTRIPGSLTLLAQGITSGGGLGAYGQAIGLIKQVQNAELAEAAAATAASAAGVEAAARKAGASILAADTEIALAQAQLRTAETAGAEAAAQTRLALANQGVARAAAEAAIAENALAVAQGRATEASAASAAASRTLIGSTGVGLLGMAAVAGGVFAAFKQMQGQIKDDGDLTKFRDNLGLTHQEMLRLTDGTEQVSKGIKKLTDVTITFGDFAHGVFSEVGNEINKDGAWDKAKSAASSAFSFIGHAWNVTSAALSAGMWTLADIVKDVFQYIAQKIGQGFYDGVNKAIDAINGLNAKIPKWAGGGDPNLIPHLKADPKVATLGGLGRTIQQDADFREKDELARNEKLRLGIIGGAEDSARKRMQEQGDALRDNRREKHPHEKKENDHGLAEALSKLEAEIKGQYDLAAAYQVSGAAAQRATANQKAAEDAISHKGGLDQFRALELQKLVANDVAKQAKANEGLQIETSIRARLNGQIADGTLTVGQYNDQLKLQTTLNGLNIDLENADLAHKQAVKDIIQQTIDLQGQRLSLESELRLIEGTQSNNKETDRIKFENSLWGEGNKARAVALAQYDAINQLRDTIDPQNRMTQGGRADYIQSAINKATAADQDPFHQWAKGIPKDAADINTALQSIGIKGFDSLASSIAGVVTGTESLGKAFKDISRSIISDIIQMTIKMLIFRAISSIIGGGIGQSTHPIVGGVDPLAPLPDPPHAATGGSMIIGGNGGVDNNVMSINGQPKAMVGQGETLAVFPAGKAPNDNQRGPIDLKISFGSAPDFAPYVEQVAGAAAGQAVRISVDHTNQTIKALRRPGISGGR
jgi:hypothetical protein